MIVALTIALGVVGLPAASAEPTVQGSGEVFHLVPGGGGPGVMPGDAVDGASASIHRNHSGVTFNIHTVGLDPNHAYTVWVFEVNCETCAGPIQLTGHVVGGSGQGNFAGRLGINPDPTRPVQDPIGGDYHVIIADHGPLDPSEMPNAIKSGIPPFTNGTQNWEQLVIFAP